MLRVTINIEPFGDQSAARTLHCLEITNIKPHRVPASKVGCDGEWREYEVRQFDPSGEGVKSCVVEHNRQDGALVLLRLALEGLEAAE